MTTNSPLLVADSVRVHYGQSIGVQDVCIDLLPGQTLAVLGANGAGKSSLARAICGLVPPSAGTITIDGRDVTGMRAHALRRLGVAYLPETRGIFPTLTVEDNLRMSARWVKGKGTRRAWFEHSYELFPVLGRRKTQQAGTLSGGEQQMLALACQLGFEPRLLVADELSLGLAPLIVDEMFEHLGRVRESGVAIILIEQFVERALTFAERVLVLRRGRVAWEGAATDASLTEIGTQYIGGA